MATRPIYSPVPIRHAGPYAGHATTPVSDWTPQMHEDLYAGGSPQFRAALNSIRGQTQTVKSLSDRNVATYNSMGQPAHGFTGSVDNMIGQHQAMQQWNNMTPSQKTMMLGANRVNSQTTSQSDVEQQARPMPRQGFNPTGAPVPGSEAALNNISIGPANSVTRRAALAAADRAQKDRDILARRAIMANPKAPLGQAGQAYMGRLAAARQQQQLAQTNAMANQAMEQEAMRNVMRALPPDQQMAFLRSIQGGGRGMPLAQMPAPVMIQPGAPPPVGQSIPSAPSMPLSFWTPQAGLVSQTPDSSARFVSNAQFPMWNGVQSMPTTTDEQTIHNDENRLVGGGVFAQPKLTAPNARPLTIPQQQANDFRDAMSFFGKGGPASYDATMGFLPWLVNQWYGNNVNAPRRGF